MPIKLPPTAPPAAPQPAVSARDVELLSYQVAVSDFDGAADIAFVDSLGAVAPAATAQPASRPFRVVRVAAAPAPAQRPWEPVRRIGHSWLAIFVALAGGLMGRALYDSQAAAQDAAEPTSR